MNKELDDKLVATFPLLYRDRHRSMMETCMCWGFDCSDGWFDIIWDLSAKLEPLIRKEEEKLKEEGHDYKICASQVKEKYGTLRFYMNSETEEMSKLIREAEEKTEVTCEDCGKPGVLMSTKGSLHGWIRTQCFECGDKAGYRPRGETLEETIRKNMDNERSNGD